MASAFTVSPSALHDHNIDSTTTSHQNGKRGFTSSTSLDDNGADFTSFLPDLDSPSFATTREPFDPDSPSAALSDQYSPDNFDNLNNGGDPFFGANFNNLDAATPTFLDESANHWERPSHNGGLTTKDGLMRSTSDASSYPLTPDQTASIHTTTPGSEFRSDGLRSFNDKPSLSISPQQLQKQFKQISSAGESSQLTPSHSGGSYPSSEDGQAAKSLAMQSPRFTVSMYGNDSEGPVRIVPQDFEDEKNGSRAIDNPTALSSRDEHNAASRDDSGQWNRDSLTGHRGLDPDHRPSSEGLTINEIAAQHDLDDKNQKIDHWISEDLDARSVPGETPHHVIDEIEHSKPVTDDGIPLGDATVNRRLPGQTYIDGSHPEITAEDYGIIMSDRNFGSAPMFPQIQPGESGRYQPQSSQAAIERWQRMAADTESIISRAATWGTRRRSLPSIMDVEGITSGSFFKRLSINRSSLDKGGSRSSSIFKDLRGLVRKPSQSSALKRLRSHQGEEADTETNSGLSKVESDPHLSPLSRESSRSKKAMPSINTALVSMGGGAATIASSHARSGSISNGNIASPKSPLTLSIGSISRRRSRSEAPKPSQNQVVGEEYPNLVGMWKKTGGPPVASLAKPHHDPEDDDDDDDENFEDPDLKADAHLVDGTIPNFHGFQQHVLKLNPLLEHTSHFLIDRIAQQQVVRYKTLLTQNVRHLGLRQDCLNGHLCVTRGGQANNLDPKGDARGLDPLVDQFDDDDEAGNLPLDGTITQDNFPSDIPMPPTQRMPAEFECRICFQGKRFQKPSDWTKHVHEDVQPFTCTWDECRDAKMFKRKADWVRHENERHRHLEWWICDFDDCRHVCYRRDNFLQHLVREHKFNEPKVKTKAAIKKAGGADPTWQRVEQCHVETNKRPQEEPCRFCGKSFPTWKKLTVHLAKHMEQISLPVLRLVTARAKEIDADTIISPVQDPPPRPVIPVSGSDATSTPIIRYSSDGQPLQLSPMQQHQFQNQEQYVFPGMQQLGPRMQQQQPQFLSPTYNGSPQLGMGPIQMSIDGVHSYNASPHLGNIPVTTGPYITGTGQPYVAMAATDQLEAYSNINALGLQGMDPIAMGQQPQQQTMGGYDGSMMDPSVSTASPFSGQGSVSPYMSSPHVNNVGRENHWGAGPQQQQQQQQHHHHQGQQPW